MRLLIVEDDPELSRQLSDIFKESGYAVDVANDGEQSELRHDALIVCNVSAERLGLVDTVRSVR